ncbi:MAG: hypothetical protein IKH61_09255 [Bacteroidales bacterium]|nr:hypothetical protein [Bacteroidales bacterium]
MKLNCLIGLQLLLALARCLKNNCWPSLPLLDCIDGWKEMDVDTTYLTSDVVMANFDRLRIQFGNGNIGINVDNGNAPISMIVNPIIKENGALEFPYPEYPSGGFNSFTGNYIGTDTIVISIKYGYLMGSYNKYQIVGVRTR